MYYGRKRTFEFNRSTQKRSESFLVRSFQKKYSAFIVTAFLGCGLLFLLPAAWYINTNFQLLSELALETSPRLLGHLEREIQWLNIYLVLTLSGLVISCLVLTRKLTYHLIEPAQKIERYLNELLEGNYQTLELQTLSDHDLQNLAETAKALHQNLQKDASKNRQLIEKLSSEVRSREAHEALQLLRDYYKKRSPHVEPRLGLVSESNATEIQHRAS